MSAEPGWYPFPDDPPGTVRRWNGSEWIGFPVSSGPAAARTPQVSEPPGTQAAAVSAGTRSTNRRPRPRALPFQKQRPLTIFAILAVAGLVASIAATVDVILELRTVLAPTAGRSGSTPINSLAMSDPLKADSTRRMLIVWCGGGAFFLLWLWRAHRHTGIPAPLGGAHVGWWNPIGWLVMAFLSTMLRPVTRSMTQLVALIGNDPERLKVTTIVAFLWRWLWVVSAYGLALGWIVTWNEARGPTRSTATFSMYLLTAHAVSLVLAGVLVAVITHDHERRFRR